jgi:sulfopyruvate decarboxylase TPP-binding subunit
MQVFVKYRTNEPVIVSPGNSGTVLYNLGHRAPTLYNTSLAYAGPCCFGLALARPDLKVIAIEGDGSLIAGLGFVTTLARYPVKNFILLIIDNGIYFSTGRGKIRTAAGTISDLGAISRAAGIKNAVTVTTIREFEGQFVEAQRNDGPCVIIAKVERSEREFGRKDLERPDRTEASLLFRRWLTEHPPLPGSKPFVDKMAIESRAEERQSESSSEAIIYRSLKDSGVNFIVYLPDSVTYPIQELAELDPEMLTLCCAREDEGIAIAIGAYQGGLCPAIVMEGSGVGYSGLALALCKVYRTPLLIVSSHSVSLGVRFDHDTTSRLTNEPILQALRVPYEILKRIADAPALIRESVHSMLILKQPVGVVIPPFVVSDRGLK